MGGAEGAVIVLDVVMEMRGCVAGEDWVEGHLAEGLQVRLHAGVKHVPSGGTRQWADAARLSSLFLLPARHVPTHHICHLPAAHTCKHSSSELAE